MRVRRGAWLLSTIVVTGLGCEHVDEAREERAASPTAVPTSVTAPSPVDASADTGEAGTAPSGLARLEALVAAVRAEPDAARRDALVDAYVAATEADGGFPIVEAGKLAVVYVDRERRGGSFAVAGDHNAWSVTASPLERVVEGASLYVRVEPFTPTAARSRYKIVRGGADYLADPLARRFAFDTFGEHSLAVAGSAESHRQRLRDIRDRKGRLAARTVEIHVPAAYEAAPAEGLPVLVMQDGQNLFASKGAGSWNVDLAVDAAIARGEVRPFLVVAVPHGPDRFAEYTHTTDSLPGIGAVGGLADAYAAYVVDDVLPVVRRQLRTREGAASTAIGGSSLGGLVSLYVARARPDVFGAALSFSGTMSWGTLGAANPTIEALYRARAPRGLALYVDSGGSDGGGCANLTPLVSEERYDQYCESRAMRDALVALGWTLGRDLHYVWEPNALHDEAAWARRFPAAIRAMFPAR
jgi:predicted alpha/beta superfamily hydrolase